MSWIRTAIIFLLFGCIRLSQQGAVADEVAIPTFSTGDVRTEFLVVQMPQATALKLIPQLRDPRQSEEAAAGLWESIVREEIKLVELSVNRCLSAHRSVNECYQEIRYPTEFNPPSVPQIFASTTPFIEQLALKHPLDIPTSFETRNAGLTLEFEPVASSSSVITLSIVSRLVELCEMKRFLADPVTQEPNTQYAQPQFRTSGVTTSIDLPTGKWQLVNVFVLPGPRPEMRLSLLRCTLLPLRQ
jgi:hypothetical protein